MNATICSVYFITECYKNYMIRDYFLENFGHLKGDFTQEEVASLTGIPRGRISTWLSRKTIPSPEDLELLSKAFRVEPYYFLMKPGTQGAARPVERFDNFEVFMNELVQKALRPVEQEAYKKSGGAQEFIRQLRENFETDNIIHMSDWFLGLQKELHKYTSLSIVEKAQRRVAQKSTEKKKTANGQE